MINIVTFETARAIKDAGFPQPDLTSAHRTQFWYDNYGDVIHLLDGYVLYHMLDGGLGHHSLFSDLTEFVESSFYHCFAPTATDILKQMPIKSLTFFPGDGIDDPWWQVEYFDEIKPNGTMLAEHSNPAEACAAAWLHLHQNKTL